MKIENFVKDNLELEQRSRWKIVLLSVIFSFILLRFVDVFFYPHTSIVPESLFFVIAIIQLFLLWFNEVREKYRILWVKRKREELNEMKEKFTVMTTHELMTPLTMIKGYADMIMGGFLGELTERQKNGLNVIKKHSVRLESIRDKLGSLYAGIPPTFEKSLEPVTIKEIIEDITGDVAPFILKRNQGLEADIGDRIPQVVMYRNGIRQVILNLVLNAIRFTPDKGKIVIRARDDNGGIRVEVEDNGVGIHKNKLDSIFEGFYGTGDISKHSSGSIEFKSAGMGLGLTIAKEIINAHKGKIWAESEANNFSRFIFTLPAR